MNLLIEDDFKYFKFKIKEKKDILSNLEKDILKPNINIKQDNEMKNIFEKDLKDLWNSLDDTLENLKLGKKKKYIKYLMIRDPPPKEINNKLKIYLKKVLKLEETTINGIYDDFENLLDIKEKDFDEKCEENNWDFENKEDKYKLKMIIELFKQKDKESNKGQNWEKEINEKVDKNKSEKKYKKRDINSDKDKYLFYNVIEVYEYKTSEKNMTNGLKNPINEFEKICKDFNIKYYNNCNYIDYNEAKKKKLSTFVLWGSKDGLELFFKENCFDKQFNKFMNDTEYCNKAGIYLTININKNIGYFIIWPGEFSYQYNRIDEPSDNMLLTLVRYGFSLSPNPIICLTIDEIQNFDFKGYNIFQGNKTSAFASQKNKIYINENKEKTFKIESKRNLDENLKDKLKNKKITQIKINLNCLLFYEEIEDRVNINEKKENLNNYIRYNSKILLKFDDNFEISAKEFYLLIKNIPFYQQNNKNDEICIEEKLKDFLLIKINNDINDLLEELNNKVLNQKYFEERYRCYCGTNSNQPLYYNPNQKKITFFIINLAIRIKIFLT